MQAQLPLDLTKKEFLKLLQQQAESVLQDSQGELWQQRQAYKEQLKTLEKEQKALSKSIGPAKKSGADVSDLMAQMQALSAELKQLKKQQAEIEQTLYLDYQSAAEESLAEEQKQLELKQIDLQKLEIKREDNEAAWQAFVSAHPQATFYHQYSLLSLLQRQFGHQAYRFVAYYDGELVGVLPILRQSSRLFGDFCSSVPFFNYGGALETAVGVKQALMSFASQQLIAEGASYCEFRDDNEQQGWQCKTDKVIMKLALPNSVEALDKQIGTKLRAQIKRPLRENPEVKIGSLELLDDYYRVFAENMRDLGTPVYQKSFFEDLLKTYESAVLIVVYLQGKPVSTGFLIGHQDELEIPWASTLRSANKYSMNMLLYWRV